MREREREREREMGGAGCRNMKPSGILFGFSGQDNCIESEFGASNVSVSVRLYITN